MATSAEPQAQTQPVAFPHLWPLGDEPLQLLAWLCSRLLRPIVLGLEWARLPALMVLPRRLLQEYFICPGDHHKTRCLVLLGRHPLMPGGSFLLLQQSREVVTDLLIRALGVP